MFRASRLAGAIGLAGLMISGCFSAAPEMELPASLRLAIGQRGAAGGLRVTFREVVSDSRCPLNANCIWAGEAVVGITLAARGRSGDFELALYDASRRVAAFGDYRVEFKALAPLPVAGQTTPRSDIRATFEVREE